MCVDYASIFGPLCRSVGAQSIAQSWHTNPSKPKHWTLLTIPYCEVRYTSAVQPSTPNFTRNDSFKIVRKGVLQNHSNKITGEHVMSCFSYQANLHTMTIMTHPTSNLRFIGKVVCAILNQRGHALLPCTLILMQQAKKLPLFYHGSKLLERSPMV